MLRDQNVIGDSDDEILSLDLSFCGSDDAQSGAGAVLHNSFLCPFFDHGEVFSDSLEDLVLFRLVVEVECDQDVVLIGLLEGFTLILSLAACLNFWTLLMNSLAYLLLRSSGVTVRSRTMAKSS